jgi:2-keto-3-deoxy-L-fuconate dehydrogenase
MSHEPRLAGKTILITAAAQGIGRASALACAKEGAHVIATDINFSLLEELPKLSKHIQIEHLDVCDAQAIKSLASRTPALDVLFNCAGMVHHGSVLECDDDAWALSFNVNVTSMHRMIRAFLPGMLERAKTTRSASIINTASIASSIKGLPNRYAYGASKAAVVGLTKALAADFVGQGLRCNALCPGTVDTPSLRGRIAAAPDPVAAEKNFIARQPIGRLATVDDITPMVVFLASDESRYITGQNLSVDGGISI